MKQSTGDSKSARAAAEARLRADGIEELVEIVARLRRAVDAGGRGAQARPRVRYADRSEDGDAAPAKARQTSGVWGR
jgi:hypothetical protein